MTNTPIRISADVEVLDNATLMALVGPNSDDPSVPRRERFEDVVLVSMRRKPITAKTIEQRRYVHAIRRQDKPIADEPIGPSDEKENAS